MTSTLPRVAQTLQAAPAKPRTARPRLIVAHLSTKAWVVCSWAMPASASVSAMLAVARDSALSLKASSVGLRKM